MKCRSAAWATIGNIRYKCDDAAQDSAQVVPKERTSDQQPRGQGLLVLTLLVMFCILTRHIN